MEITTYAPVIIPTLNRYEHFVRCLESLEKCIGADKTDVYVALDYPPSEKYKDGWLKIANYLTQKETKNKFGKLIVIKRECNYGICHENGNLESLMRLASLKYDRFVFSEDDNEFSPCFLEYMNQNLEKYKDDSTIFRICGYLPWGIPVENHSFSQFVVDRHIAWGVGCWTHKEVDRNDSNLRHYFTTLAKDKRIRNYFESDKLYNILTSLVRMSKGGAILDDVVSVVRMEATGMRCILPTKSMVRNHGWDGSGQHGGYVTGYKEQEICTNFDYVLKEAPVSFTEDFERRMHESRRNRKRSLNEYVSAITWYLYKYTGIFCEFEHLHDWGKYLKNKFYGSK